MFSFIIELPDCMQYTLSKGINKLLLSKRVISGLDLERISLWMDLLERSYLRIFNAIEHKS